MRSYRYSQVLPVPYPGSWQHVPSKNRKHRIITILIAPLMTCSARLPVYSLIIGAFIPQRSVGPFNLQGLVLFTLYISGILAAISVAWILNRLIGKKRISRASDGIAVLSHATFTQYCSRPLGTCTCFFSSGSATVIFATSVLLMGTLNLPFGTCRSRRLPYPVQLCRTTGTLAGIYRRAIGFNWQIAVALIPGMAAREIAVSALGTVYALSATGEDLSLALASVIASNWSLPTACRYCLVCIRSAMLRHTGGHPARNQFMVDHVFRHDLPLRPGLSRILGHLPHQHSDTGYMILQELIVCIIVAVACGILYIHGTPPVWKYRIRTALSYIFLFLRIHTLAQHIAPKHKPPSPYPGCHGCSGCTATSEKPIRFMKPPCKRN